jgi:hypothetical protein
MPTLAQTVMFRGRLPFEVVIPRSVLDTLKGSSDTSPPESFWSSPSTSRASSFSGTTTTMSSMLPSPLTRRRSSIPLFRRRANVLVRFLLLFVCLPISIYVFATSRATRLRKEALLNELIRDPAWTGKWPDGIRIPAHRRDAGNTHGQRIQGRSNDDEEEQEKLVDWRYWTVNETGAAAVPFWGNVDVAGPSPFDHVPPASDGGKGKRVMFLTGTYSQSLSLSESPALSLILARLRYRLSRLPRTHEYSYLRNRRRSDPTSRYLSAGCMGTEMAVLGRHGPVIGELETTDVVVG